MAELRIVIVDDSPFSIAVIRGVLEDAGFEVVGEASSLEEVKDVVKNTKPNLVTMDMTLPGADGFECTRAVHAISPSTKVIIISSMMDDEIVQEAKKNKASGYIQKPVDSDELLTLIHRITDHEELFQTLDSEFSNVFKEAMLDGMNKMTKTLLHYKKESFHHEEHSSAGLTIIMGIIGSFSGRMLLDMKMETAERVVSSILKRNPSGNDEILAAIGELANIISGNACSILNRRNKAYGLRVAPPTIMHGEQVHISAPSYKTFSALAETDFGDILINVGFQRGDDHWM